MNVPIRVRASGGTEQKASGLSEEGTARLHLLDSPRRTAFLSHQAPAPHDARSRPSIGARPPGRVGRLAGRERQPRRPIRRAIGAGRASPRLRPARRTAESSASP